MLELVDIRKSFQNGEEVVTALDGVSLTIQQNEFVAVMGSSGSGKSTLMNVLGCLDTPDSGTYMLAGQNVASHDDDTLSKIRNSHIGFIFQTFHLLSKLDAVGNVILPLRYSNLSSEEAESRAVELLNRVGLGNRMSHKPFEMSGGQRQRVALARALVIMDLLSELHRAGQTIVMVTHEEDIAEHAQRVIRMKDGRVLFDE
jgi:putative ABC transport system ATP-binding protein